MIVGRFQGARLETMEVHRFANGPVETPGGLHWDAMGLFENVVIGLRKAVEATDQLHSIGIDSWGVDFGLLDEAGGLHSSPHHYRDQRTERGVAHVKRVIDDAALYQRTGLQFLPFNTIYQLAASLEDGELNDAQTMLLMPDLIGYLLTGRRATEQTNASTTGLVDVTTSAWANDLIERVGLSRDLFTDLAAPGTVLGDLQPAPAAETGATRATVTLVGSHDTASAVVGVPAVDEHFAYISSGTWSLVGVELARPIVTEEARLAGFTNEAGVDGQTRFLHNVMGLWMLQESMRQWQAEGRPLEMDVLLAGAAQLPPGGPIIDPDDSVFIPPGDMVERIRSACRNSGQPEPNGPHEVARCILDSLARAYATAVLRASQIAEREVRVVHVVGGGSRNDLLCQLTADACGLPVLAGPAEATALGNLLVQARAHGLISGSLFDLRAIIRRSEAITRYEPSGKTVVGA